jgi:hypothetical protein
LRFVLVGAAVKPVRIPNPAKLDRNREPKRLWADLERGAANEHEAWSGQIRVLPLRCGFLFQRRNK